MGLVAPAGLGMALIKAFCVAIGEEFFFRGLIQTGLNALPGLCRKKLVGVSRGTVVAALIFSLAHLPNLAYRPAGYVLTQLITALVFGLLYGWCYERSGNLWGAVYLHTFWDWAIVSF